MTIVGQTSLAHGQTSLVFGQTGLVYGQTSNFPDPSQLSLLLVGNSNFAFSGDQSTYDVGLRQLLDRQLADLDLSPALVGMTFLKVSGGSRRATFDNIISILESQ